MKLLVALLATLCAVQALPAIRQTEQLTPIRSLLIKDVAGLGDLKSLLDDFLKQVNFDAMVALWKQKEAASDADLMEVIDYLKSADFKAIYDYMHASAADNDFPNFLQYLSDGGLDIAGFEAWLAKELGWNSVARPAGQLGDFKSLVDEFLALVDQDALVAWAVKTLATNADAQALVARLQKPEAAATAAYLEKNTQYQALLQIMRDDNIDIDAIIDAIKKALGWDTVTSALIVPVGDLKSLLDDFLKQVNFDAMVALWKQKEAASDADLMEVIDYLKSADFKAIYDYMHASAADNDFPNFLQYLSDGGLDIAGFEAWLAKELGWNSVARPASQLGDFKSLVDEFLALVDQDALVAWAVKTLATNADAQALVARLQKPEAAATAAYLEKNTQYQALLQIMRDDNIDIDAIIDAIKKALGWDTVTSALIVPVGDLKSLLDDFLKQVNFDAMVALWKQKEAASDADLMEVIDYLKSADFKAIYDYMHASAADNDFPNFLQYLSDGGLDIAGFEAWLAKELGWNSVARPAGQLGDFKSLVDEFLALVDQDALVAWAVKTLATNADAQALVARLQKPEAAATAAYLEKNTQYQALLQIMRDDNIDIDAIIDAIKKALGWDTVTSALIVPVGDLKSLLDDFLKQVNFDAMVALWKQKEAASDADLMEVIDYLKSADFKAIYDYMHASAADNDFPNFLQYLSDGGLDIAGFEAWLAKELGWNSVARPAGQLGDFKSLVDEFLALVDQDALVAWAVKTLATNADAQALVARLQKPEAAATAAYLEKNTQYQALLQIMRDDNIDIDAIIDAIKKALGWDTVTSALIVPVGDLKSLLDDFLKQVNFDAMVALWKQKEAASDADLMEVIDYLKSADFKAIYDYMHASAADNDFPNFLQYLSDGGLDIAGFEAWLAKELGWNSVARPAGQLGDFKSLVDEFLALVDQDALVAWAVKTLATNADAQALVARLQKPEAAATAAYLEKNTQYQALLQIMRDDNIDIDAIIDAIKKALGWDTVTSALIVPVGDLKSLLDDFLKQVNFDAMVALWKQKEAASDADLMEVIDYLKSADFKAIYDYMHASAADNDFPNFLQYLSDGGLDIAGFEAWLAKELGWNSVARPAGQLGDFKSLVDEFLALVDQDALVAWAVKTLATNADAQALVARLQKPEAAATAAYLEKNTQYQALLQIMRDDNIDIDAIIDAIKKALGW